MALAPILLTFSPAARSLYYGDAALAGLRALGDVRLNAADDVLDPPALIDAAAGCEIIVADRLTPGYTEVFRELPDLVAFVRCAMDIRNIDVAAASANGVLVTRASAGFTASVAEWVIGAMIDLGRHITVAAEAYRGGNPPLPTMGRELKGSTLGVIGYGAIGRYVCDLALAFRMRVVVSDPLAHIENGQIESASLQELLARSDFVVCLAPATPETENLMNRQAFAQMKPSAYFINASRGNLVDETALAQALDSGQIAGCALDVGRAPDQMPTPELARIPRSWRLRTSAG